jgi:ABC-type transport system involved in multi-copper enzyme maturation permease subunit
MWYACWAFTSSITPQDTDDELRLFGRGIKVGMRWKLLLICSLLATLLGTGATIGIILGFFGSPEAFGASTRFAIAILAIPVVAIVAASIFIYRHTSRRRRLQALLTALLTGVLTISILVLSSVLLSRATKSPRPTSPRSGG